MDPPGQDPRFAGEPSPSWRPTKQRPTKATQAALLEENLILSRRLIRELGAAKRHLEQENEELREQCEHNRLVSVIVFREGDKLHVCGVANGDRDGIEFRDKVARLFQDNASRLSRKQIQWVVMDDVPVNRANQIPTDM